MEESIGIAEVDGVKTLPLMGEINGLEGASTGKWSTGTLSKRLKNWGHS
jgi:hypothetical protein